MKKMIALLLAAMMVLSMAACASKTAETAAPADTAEPAAAGTAAAADSDLAYIQDKGTLVIGITDFEPMDYKDENGEWTGFDAEFARMFAKELGVDCEFFVIADWGQKFFELDSKNIDAIWNGMTITDEPGVYETDEVGIRIENELECVDAGTNQYGHWLKFEPLTLVPISTEPVIVDELTRDQINWLNAYHAHVYEMLSPRLTEEEKTWLKAKTAPIDR